MVHDGAPIERQLNALDSGIMTRVRAQNNLPLGYDLNSVTKTEAEAFDPMDTENVRIGYDGTEVEGTPFKLLVPFDVYKIYPEQLEFRKALIESLDYVMQIRDLVELSKAKVLGKDMEAMEKLLSSLGPIVRDVGVEMEKSLGRVGNLVRHGNEIERRRPPPLDDFTRKGKGHGASVPRARRATSIVEGFPDDDRRCHERINDDLHPHRRGPGPRDLLLAAHHFGVRTHGGRSRRDSRHLLGGTHHRRIP
jgi:hypothetical protein